MWSIDVNLSILKPMLSFFGGGGVGWAMVVPVQPNKSVEVVLWLCLVGVGVVTIFPIGI